MGVHAATRPVGKCAPLAVLDSPDMVIQKNRYPSSFANGEEKKAILVVACDRQFR